MGSAMTDDVPWVLGLTDEEVQELRSKKQELTEYGKQKIRELMTHEEMLEEAARREKENKVLDIAKKFMEENSEAMEQLAAIERKDLIDYALEELNAIVMGGQDTREFYQSVTYIRKVLESLK